MNNPHPAHRDAHRATAAMNYMIAVDEAMAIIRRQCTTLPTERIALTAAADRVLARPVDALHALPPFDNSAMDGFAVCWHTELAAGSTLAVHAEQVAGDGIANQLDGACSIMTGARIPDGLDTVVPVENCTVTARDDDGRPTLIVLSDAPAQGQHVRRCGEDVAHGQRVLDAGARLSDEALMVLRGMGVAEVDVYRRPRVALACTGRELVDADGAALAPGQIANTNGPYLERLFAAAGAEVVERITVPDEPDALRVPLQRWLDAGIDIVVTTGAVSMGRHDFVPDVLADVGAAIHFHKLKMRPGKPLLFATAGRGSLVFGLPGNPISSMLGARFFVNTALRAMNNLPPEVPMQLPLAAVARKKSGPLLIQKAGLELAADGRLQVRLLHGQESFRTLPLLATAAWVMLAEDATELAAGASVPVYPLRPNGAMSETLFR